MPLLAQLPTPQPWIWSPTEIQGVVPTRSYGVTLPIHLQEPLYLPWARLWRQSVTIINALPTKLSNSSTAVCDCLLCRPRSSRIQIICFLQKTQMIPQSIGRNEATPLNASILTAYSLQVAINRHKVTSQGGVKSQSTFQFLKLYFFSSLNVTLLYMYWKSYSK